MYVKNTTAQVLLIFLFSCIALSIWSCKDSQGTTDDEERYHPPENMKQIIPTDSADYWSFWRETHNTSSSDTTLYGRRLIDTSISSGTRLLHYLASDNNFPIESNEYYESISNSEYIRYTALSDPDSTPLKPLVMLKLPIANGARWKAASWDSLNYFGYFKIINYDSTLTTRSGKLPHAIHVQSEYPSSSQILYEFFIVPKTGIVFENYTVDTVQSSIDLIYKNFH